MKRRRGRPVGGTSDVTQDGPRCPKCFMLMADLDCAAAGRCQARADVWEKLPAIHRLMLAINADARAEELKLGGRARQDEARKVARALAREGWPTGSPAASADEPRMSAGGFPRAAR